MVLLFVAVCSKNTMILTLDGMSVLNTGLTLSALHYSETGVRLLPFTKFLKETFTKGASLDSHIFKTFCTMTWSWRSKPVDFSTTINIAVQDITIYVHSKL